MAADRDRGTEMAVHLDWGSDGLDARGPAADVIVIVDVLSFSTCVDVAVARGAEVYPCRWHDHSAGTLATEHHAHLAKKRGESGYTLSPASLRGLLAGERLVLPSPNGSTLSTSASEHGIVVAACLRNATAVARACAALGRAIALIPAGERWPSGGLRPALEDLLGAGAVASHFATAHLSPDAQAAAAAFVDARQHLHERLLECRSGRELVDRGFARDVELSAMLDVSDAVPLLHHGAFRRHAPR